MSKKINKKNVLNVNDDGSFFIPAQIRNLVNLESFEMILENNKLRLDQILDDKHIEQTK